LVEMRTNIW